MDIDLREIGKILRRRWLLIGLLAVFAALATGAVSFFVLKPQYEATTTLLVQSSSSGSTVNVNDLVETQKLLTTYGEIIKSRQIASDVAARLNLPVTADDLLRQVEVRSASESLVTTIAVRDESADRAVQIANGFAQSFSSNLPSIMKVDNVSILDSAKRLPNMRPVTPQPYLNMAVALVMGLLVGAGLAFLLEFLDQTVKSEQEVEDLLGVPLLGMIATFEKETKPVQSLEEKGGAIRHEREAAAGALDLPR